MSTSSPARQDESRGLAYTTAAFVWWGLSPIFWKQITHVPATQLLAHRILWAALIMLAVVALRSDFDTLRRHWKGPRELALNGISTALISLNWLLYIWAISTSQILQASLGYFINPLISVFLGLVVLGERLRRAQTISVLLAATGVAVLTAKLGYLPWISLLLAVSFGLYGLIKKVRPISPENGLAVETGLLMPFALLFLVLSERQDVGVFGHESLVTDLLLISSGVITAAPLVWFAHGAKRLPLNKVGILQYLAPSGQFLLAVFVYGETFDREHQLAFALIWAALALFTYDSLRTLRTSRRIDSPS